MSTIEQDLSESDAGLARLQEYYTEHCQMQYNQYLRDLSRHNPTHAFDFDPNEES